MLTRKTHKVIWGIILGIGGVTVLFYIFAFILVAIGSQPPHPPEQAEFYSVGQTNIMYNEEESVLIDEDCAGRLLFKNYEKSDKPQDFPIYLIVQEGYSKPLRFNYLPGEYYYFDYDNSGTTSERFLEFKKKNHWGEEKLVDELKFEKIFVSTEYVRNKAIWQYGNDRNQSASVTTREKVAYLFDEFHVSENFEVMSSVCDSYYRMIFGIKVPPKIYGGSGRLYAICLQASWGDSVFYLENAYCAEIRIDHYAEDMEAFKNANDWETQTTIEKLKKIYNRNLTAKDSQINQQN